MLLHVLMTTQSCLVSALFPLWAKMVSKWLIHIKVKDRKLFFFIFFFPVISKSQESGEGRSAVCILHYVASVWFYLPVLAFNWSSKGFLDSPYKDVLPGHFLATEVLSLWGWLQKQPIKAVNVERSMLSHIRIYIYILKLINFYVLVPSCVSVFCLGSAAMSEAWCPGKPNVAPQLSCCLWKPPQFWHSLTHHPIKMVLM